MGSLVIIKELLTWRAAVDILLITALLFFLYHTLLRLGTWAIFTGILLAMAFFSLPIFSTTVFCKIIAPPAIQPVDKRWPDVQVTVEVSPIP